MAHPIRICCIHTAAVHEATFARLFADAAPMARIEHLVQPEWLSDARSLGLAAPLIDKVRSALVSAADRSDAVLLTCSTLGPLADEASRERPNIARIDTPLMRRAAAHADALLVMCLESTKASTVALHEAECARAGRPPRHNTLVCSDAWRFFEAGDPVAFGSEIAASVRDHLALTTWPSCIVLAQASMAIAEPLLADVGVPVYSSPRLAVEEVLRVAAQLLKEPTRCA